MNTSKTKIVVFRKQGRLLPNDQWSYDGQNIEVVTIFNYFGTIFNYTGNFALYQKHLASYYLKALNLFLYKCKVVDINLKFCVKCLIHLSA